MKPEFIKKKNELVYQQVLFRIVDEIPNLIVYPFYYILLYKQTNSFEVLFLERAVQYIALWIGFTIFTFLVDRLGYLHTFRLSSILQAISFSVVFLLIGSISQYYILFAILLGFSRGTYWPTYHAINLKEVHGLDRGKVIDINFSIMQILAIVLPVLAGATIDYKPVGLKILIIIVIFVYLTAATMPWTYNKRPQSKIRSSEFNNIFKKKQFKKYATILGFESGASQIVATLFLYIPYMLIGSEFGVGGLATLTGIFAALAAFYERNLGMQKKMPFAYFGYILGGTSSVIFAFIWTVPLLTIRSLIHQFQSAVSGTTYTEIHYSTKEKFLGDFKKESALEMNLVDETISMIGRVLSLLIIYILMSIIHENADSVVRFILVILAFYPLITFISMKNLNRSLIK